MRVSNARLIAELLRVSTDQRIPGTTGIGDSDHGAFFALRDRATPLVTPEWKLTPEGARVVSELLAVFEEQA